MPNNAHGFLRRAHRVIAIGFLISIVPAAIVSAQGNDTSPFVYIPLFFLFGLTLSGIYLLVRPWVLHLRPDRTRSPA